MHVSLILGSSETDEETKTTKTADTSAFSVLSPPIAT